MSIIDLHKKRVMLEDIISTRLFDIDTLEIIVDCLISEDEELQDSAFIAINSIPDELKPTAAELICPEIENDNISIRNLVAECLQQLGTYSVGYLVVFLQSSNPDTRKFACDILGLISDISIYKEIEQLLNDEDLNVVLSAIETLGNLNSVESVDKLLSKYDLNLTFDTTIIESLGKIGNTESIEFLLSKINDENELIRICAIDALARCGRDKSICDYLILQIPDINESLVGVIIKTIFAIANKIEYDLNLPEEYRKFALSSIKDQDKDIQIASLVSLGRIYSDEEVDFIFNELDIENHSLVELFFFNLISYNSEISLKKVIDRILTNYKELSILEIFTIFSTFSTSIDFQKRVNCFAIIINYLIDENSNRTYDIYDFFFSMDKDAVDTVKNDLLKGSNSEKMSNFLNQKILDFQSFD